MFSIQYSTIDVLVTSIPRRGPGTGIDVTAVDLQKKPSGCWLKSVSGVIEVD